MSIKNRIDKTLLFYRQKIIIIVVKKGDGRMIATATEVKRGRPTKDKIRNKQIRYGKIQDELLKLAQEINNQEDKEKVLSLLEELKKPSRKKCS